MSLDRRALLGALSVATAAGLLNAPRAFAQPGGLQFGPAAPFSYEALVAMAQARAAQAYAPPVSPSPDLLHRIDYDAWGRIQFDTDKALYKDGPLPVTFFHLGRYFQRPVRLFAAQGGVAREVLYDPGYFHMPPDSPAHELAEGVGFAGFRVQEPSAGALDWRTHDWVAFLGASYFRAIGALNQYGLSARAVAVNTTVADAPEEFPDFTQIFIEEPAAGSATITVHALLDGPSVTGACRFVMTRGEGVVMDIDQALFVRKPIARLGLAPLTSMFWFSETIKKTATDWRPEVHDSDGLAMWNGRDERLWRPLNNPPGIAFSAFADASPKGFGLSQRDRVFDHYLDGVMYDRRPTLWVEPKGDWGPGSVQLIELPVDNEVQDNIIAAWVPADPVKAGARFNLSYRLHWLADEPYPSPLARCVATRLGRGGSLGGPYPGGVHKFVVEFQGGPLATLPYGVKPQMALGASRGQFTPYQRMEAVPDGVPGHWRAQFDLTGVDQGGPVDLRLTLMVDHQPVSETWLYQFHP